MRSPTVYPVAYFIEIQDFETGCWEQCKNSYAINYDFQYHVDRILWIFPVKYTTISNYQSAINDARRKTVRDARKLREHVRIVELRVWRDSFETHDLKYEVWRDGVWLETPRCVS